VPQKYDCIKTDGTPSLNGSGVLATPTTH
jgi:hypothetical protein